MSIKTFSPKETIERLHEQIKRGDRGPGPPPPEKSQKYRVLCNSGPDPLKITKLPSKHLMLGHHRHAAKRHFNGVSPAGRRWPDFSGIWIYSSI